MGLMDKLKTIFQRAVATADPAVFGSGLALKTEWVPLGAGSSAHCSHRLRHDPGSGEWRFVPGFLTKVWPWMWICSGWTGVAMIVLISRLSPDSRGQGDKFLILYAMFVLCALAGTVVGIFLYRDMARYIVFDTRNGAFFRTKTDPRKIVDVTQVGAYTPLNEVGALQILEKYVQRGKHSYMTYELNLVKKDGGRVNVVSHGAYPKLLEDAEQLAQLLKVPLWNVKAPPQ